jgi:glycosyltransferase involved in cell wall biosynthesis
MGDDVVVFCFRSDETRCYVDLMKKLRVFPLEEFVADKYQSVSKLRFLGRWKGTDPETEMFRAMAARIPGDIDLLNVHDYRVYPAACHWKRRTGKPVVWMMNDIPCAVEETWRSFPPGKAVERFLNGKWRVSAKHREYVRAFDAILALDRRDAERLLRAVGREAIVISSGLDLDAFQWFPRDPPEAGRPVRLLSNAIFLPHRRLEDIVGALCRLRDRGIPFLWRHVGPDTRDPEYADRIKSEVQQSGLSPHVEFLGEVTDERLHACFREADVFLFPNTPQSWGLAVFQAMACGTPAVVSRGAGAASILSHGENAMLVDPFSPGQIAEAVERLVADGLLWRRLHVEGRRFVEKNVRWDLYAKNMKAVFLRVARTFSP